MLQTSINHLTLGDLGAFVAERVSPHAAAVDQHARFPAEAVDALREVGLLGAVHRPDGAPVGLSELATVASALARGCGATSMVWVMHQVQRACVVAAVEPDDAQHLLDGDPLIASVTSEVGIGGDLGRSDAAAEEAPNGRLVLHKRSPTISYAEHADAFLVTARRTPDAPPEDQVAVLVDRADVSLERTSTWDAMGMRGTVSPGFRFGATYTTDRVLPVPFATLAGEVMVPWSHVLWAACWLGLAQEAFGRARTAVRRKGGPHASDVRLAEAARLLTLLRASVRDAAARPDDALDTPIETARSNDLKVSASLLAVDAAERCLTICGMAGYQERSELSIARILRDLYSARLMVGNDRIMATNARLATVRTT
jgi:acyl-CoA dehydrogenase